MPKQKQNSISKQGPAESGSVAWKHGQMVEVPISDIEPNQWNPNEMSAEEFNMLSENISDVDFLDPILVVPLPRGDGEEQRFRIVDGEHRFEQQRLMDSEMIKCVIADPERFDEDTQKFQTVRMNKIRGSLNKQKFTKLVEDLMTSGNYDLGELAHEFGFTDTDEFEAMVATARDSLPDEDMKKEFDKVKDEIQTVDDLTAVLNRLFTRYGDTIPHHFMVMDFGGKDHIWLRMRPAHLQMVKEFGRDCVEGACTMDSLVMLLMEKAQPHIQALIKKHRNELDEPDEIDDGLDMLTPAFGSVVEGGEDEIDGII